MIRQISIIIFSLIILLMVSSCTEDKLDLDSNIDSELITEEFSAANQSAHRNCGKDHKMEILLSDPSYQELHLEKFRRLSLMDNSPKQRSTCSDPVIIPMAIHFQGISNPNASCLVSLSQTQVDILNKDFTGSNSDINKWTSSAASYFPGVANGEACVKFVIANKNHPSGHGLSEGSPAVTINKTNGDQLNAFSKYLNVFVRSNLGFLGESPLGGLGNGDGVLVDAAAFGAGGGCGSVSPGAPYNLGRTLTHEVGHYLLLDHIWGGGCNVDDEVSDTPNQNQDYGGCPSLGSSSCSSTDMHMNYMDYTNDVCMYMFSAGQATRMENYISSSLTNVTNNASNIYDVTGEDNNDGDDDGDNDGDIADDNDTDDNGSDDSESDDETSDNENDDQTEICEKPSNTSVQILNYRKVTVSWPASYDATRYQVRYRIVGTSRWTRKSGSSNSKTLSNLNRGVDYEYQVRARCSTGWTGYTSKDVFNTEEEDTTGGSDDATCNTIKFELVLDQYGSETSWELVDENDNSVATGGPYQDNQEGKKINKEFCLPDGCYTMYVDDAYGDGICCDYGNGYFKLLTSSGNVIAESDGNFGSYDNLDVCLDGDSGSLRSRKTDSKSKKLARKRVLASN